MNIRPQILNQCLEVQRKRYNPMANIESRKLSLAILSARSCLNNKDISMKKRENIMAGYIILSPNKVCIISLSPVQKRKPKLTKGEINLFSNIIDFLHLRFEIDKQDRYTCDYGLENHEYYEVFCFCIYDNKSLFYSACKILGGSDSYTAIGPYIETPGFDHIWDKLEYKILQSSLFSSYHTKGKGAYKPFDFGEEKI